MSRVHRLLWVCLWCAGQATVSACEAPDRYDRNGNTREVTDDTSAASVIPDGVADEDFSQENSDADGFCFDPESGYYPCDDGAPPGSGPAGGGGGDSTPSPPGGAGGDPSAGDGSAPEGGGGSPGSTGEICTTSAYQRGVPVVPRILWVVDKSGSMDDPAVGYSGSKWEGVTQALGSVVTALDDNIEMGLMLYPDGNANQNICRLGSLAVPLRENRANDVVDALAIAVPGGGTPTAATLERAKLVLDGLGDAGGPRVVVLATDGGPNCNATLNPSSCRCVNPDGCNGYAENCLDDDNARAAAEALNAAGYSLFVIGISGSENFTEVLNGLAEAGGTALAGSTRYYPADDADALTGALESIANRVASCRFDLDGRVVNPADVTVRIGQTTVPRDPSRSFGWDLVDDDTIELFGASCSQASTSPLSITVDYCFVPGG